VSGYRVYSIHWAETPDDAISFDADDDDLRAAMERLAQSHTESHKTDAAPENPSSNQEVAR